MANTIAEIEHSVTDDAWIVHRPDGKTVRFIEFRHAEQYCRDRGWDVFVVESPWDEEFAEWH